MSPNQHIGYEEVQAFVDDELDPERFAEIAKLMETDRALSQRIATFRADKVRMVRHYEPLLDRAVPPEWVDLIEGWSQKRDPVISTRALMAMAASLLLMIGGWIAYQNLSAPAEDALVAEAIAVRTGAVPSEKSLAGEASIASNSRENSVAAALGISLKIPDLTKAGFTIAAVDVYGRDSGAKAVKIDYRNSRSQIFTLYLRPSSSPARFDMMKQGALRICVWQDDVLSTIMLGEMSAGEMLRIASLAYNGLYF